MAKRKYKRNYKSTKRKKNLGYHLKNIGNTFKGIYNWVTQTVGKVTVMFVIVAAFIWVLMTQLSNFNERTPDSSVSYEQQVEFVNTIAPTAQKLQRQYGVLASVAMAQAMIESNFGQSQLAAEHHNLFGVKTDAGDPNGVDYETQEFVNDEWITITDRFKVYADWEESLTKHAELIYYGTSWNTDFYQAVLDGKTYQEQAKGLQSAGYATDPDYANKLIAMIEEWNLTQYDQPVQ